ncbi:hypothetical protein ACIP5N_22155 [Streptomyces sp. NPDC088768]|uniref:hypothetical protein n=1 Tax=Streptomyces sp. NPDC088768 TaxID=3365894 RepID=UPI0037FB5401
MELCQLGVPADPGFRLDLDGTARFIHEGYLVELQVRRATAEDTRSYYELRENDRHDVVLTGTVTLKGIDVGTAYAVANERDGYSMRLALEEVLRETVTDVRRTVAALNARVEQIDRKHRPQP